MKTFAFFFLLIFLIACKQEAPVAEVVADEPKTEDANTVATSQDTISKQTFLTWTTAWKTNGKAYTDTLLTLYYDMPIIDLEEVVGELPAKARFYHGLEDLGGGHYEAHLILVGVDASGSEVGQYFDVTKPCPPSCG